MFVRIDWILSEGPSSKIYKVIGWWLSTVHCTVSLPLYSVFQGVFMNVDGGRRCRIPAAVVIFDGGLVFSVS